MKKYLFFFWLLSAQAWGQTAKLDSAKWIKNYFIAFDLQQKGNFYEANKMYLNLLNNPPNLEFEAYVYKNLAFLQENLSLKHSKIYLLKTIETYKKLGNDIEIVKAQIDLAKAYAQLREFGKAQKEIVAVDAVLNQKELTAKQHISIHRKLTEYYQIQNKYDSVAVRLDILLKWAEKTKDSVNIALAHIKRGKNFYDQDSIEKAISYYEKAFLFEKHLTVILKQDLYLGIAICYYGLENEKVLYYYQKLLELEKANAQAFFQELKTNHDLHRTKQKENQLALNLAQSENEKTKIKLRFMAFSGLLLFFIGILTFFIYRKRQQEKWQFQKRLLLEKQREIQIQEEFNAHIASELHDGPKSKIKLAMRQADEITYALLEDVLYDLTVISERSTHKQHLPLPRQISSFLDRVIPKESLDYHFRNPTDESRWQYLPPSTSLHLFRITTEAVSNTLKYAESPFVNVNLDIENEEIVLTIEDGGKGLPENYEQHAEGMGLRNIRHRVEILGGKLSIHSLPHEGTTIEVRTAFKTIS